MAKMIGPSTLLVGLVLLDIASAACYYPNGTVAPTNKKTCDSSAEFSACCDPDDFCINGMCKSQYGANSNYAWREQCTDPTWESDLCPKFCYDAETASYASDQVWQVLECGSGEYCCTYAKTDGTTTPNATSCCGDSERTFVLNAVLGGGVSVSSISSTTSATMASSTFSTSSAMTTSAASSTSSSSTSTPTASSAPEAQNEFWTIGTRAGVGAGVAFGVSLIVGLSVCFLGRKRKQNRPVTAESNVQMIQPAQYQPPSELGNQGAKIEMGVEESKVELGQEGRISEMPAFRTGPPVELGDTSVKAWGR